MIKGYETFERVIEIVSLDEEDKALARLRWKHYAERGYPLVRHDLSPKKVTV
jgi:DNA polymerase-3 subunit chi